MLLFLIFIQIIGCFSTLFENPNIIQLDNYTNLICSVKKNYTFINNEHGWWKNNKFIIWYNKSIIILKRDMFDEKRYSSFILDDKFILQIKNINKNETNDNFKCNLKTYNNLFPTLNSSNITNYLFSDNINIEYIVNNMKLTKININFKKVFPIPKCFVKINNKIIFSDNIIKNKTIDYIYSTVNLSMKIEKISCDNKIEIICTLIKQNFTIETKNNICFLNKIIINNSMKIILLILLSFGILFLIFVIILCIHKCCESGWMCFFPF